jgi:shikimate dehydrogenase
LRPSTDIIGDMLARLAPREPDSADDRTLVGLLGRGIGASRTPAMHEREGARLGMRYTYVLVDFDQLGLPDASLADVLAAAGASGFAGLNVTHPFKQAIIPHLDTLSRNAGAIGAVNTVVFSGGRTSGHNTDCWGFAESFRDGMQGVALDRVVQFGAGGAGAAVAHALMELGVAHLSIIDSDPDRAVQLAAAMASVFPGRVRADVDVAAAVSAADGIVNTTPVGMAKYPGMPFPPELLTPGHWVAEIIYFPAETELLRQGRALGCRTLAGAGMAVYQAVRAFELFAGRAPDRHAMRAHFEAVA